MRGVSKTLAVAVATLLFALGLGACGGSSAGDSTSTEAAVQAQAREGSNGEAKHGGAGKSGSGSEAKPGDSAHEGEGSGESSGDFVPKYHHDSGGGSKQFQVKGGDNSVQEFGGEADTSELDAAAAALHNFLDARAGGDWSAACSYLAKSVTEGLEKLAAGAKQGEQASCGTILSEVTNHAAAGELRTEAAQADVGSLRVEGKQAFVIYRGTGGTVLAVPMTKEGSAWKVASLGGTPLS